MFAKLTKKIYAAYFNEATARENAPVISFLHSLPPNSKYLELASGLGRFPLYLRSVMPKLNITCFEINESLTHNTQAVGIPTIVGNILTSDLGEEVYDVIHCSHIIEHFGYPDITHVLDAVLRATKTGGHIIIRTPLMHYGFYKEIDHIRPYPPESIFNYYNGPQQQKIGAYSVREVSRWYRTAVVQLHFFEGYKLMFYFNLLLKALWVYIRFPFSRRTGYVLILQKS